MTDAADLDIEEKTSRIRQLLADADRKAQERQLAPWQLMVAAVTAAAAIMSAGGGLTLAMLALVKAGYIG